MADRERKQYRGTPTTHLAAQLDLVAQFTDQARVGLERKSETVRIFMAIYSGFLIEAGAGIRSLLDPSVVEQATVAIRKLAPDAPHTQRDRATRLLATLWSAGIVASIDTDDWIQEAPELPGHLPAHGDALPGRAGLTPTRPEAVGGARTENNRQPEVDALPSSTYG